MGLKKNKKGFKLYDTTEVDIYRIMPKLKKRSLDKIKNKKKRLYYLRVWLVTEMQPLKKLKNSHSFFLSFISRGVNGCEVLFGEILSVE